MSQLIHPTGQSFTVQVRYTLSGSIIHSSHPLQVWLPLCSPVSLRALLYREPFMSDFELSQVFPSCLYYPVFIQYHILIISLSILYILIHFSFFHIIILCRWMEQCVPAKPPPLPPWPPASTPSGATSPSHAHTLRPRQTQVRHSHQCIV